MRKSQNKKKCAYNKTFHSLKVWKIKSVDEGKLIIQPISEVLFDPNIKKQAYAMKYDWWHHFDNHGWSKPTFWKIHVLWFKRWHAFDTS